MNDLPTLLTERWFAVVLLLAALLLGVLLVWLRSRLLLLVCSAIALMGAGGLVLTEPIGRWIVFGALGLFLVLMLVLIFTSAWGPRLAWCLGAVLLFGAGGYCRATGRGMLLLVDVAGSIDRENRAWLFLLLGLIPLTIVSWRGLGIRRRSLEPGLARRRLAFVARALALVCVALALAEPHLGVPHDHTTVLFVLDRSFSVPEEMDKDGVSDLRWKRVRKFLNDAVRLRPRGRERDQIGLIVFGRKPRLELLPGDAPRFNLQEITSQVDGNATDIAAALQLALATFPPDSARRIVLLSDGNENRGSAARLAQMARSAGVEIDVVPLGAGKRQENEVLVERVEAPMQVERGAPLPLKVWVRSYSPNPVVGTLVVRQISTRGDHLLAEPLRVKLELGLNPFSFRVPPSKEDESYTYEAEFQPENLPGDRPQNNRAATHVIARGRRRVLLLEAEVGKHEKLFDTLRASGPSRFQVESRSVDFLGSFPDGDRLAAWLGNFDCILLCNIPADRMTAEQMEAIRANTHDQGCGLVMVGGPESYGAGGWQNTAVEKALPVDADIKGIETDDKSGLVLIMHASEMADGNMWQKRIAKLAIERLSPRDHVGILHYDFNVSWHIPMGEVGADRNRLMRLVDRLVPGDMPDFDPALKMAYDALTDPKRRLSRRHVILISDGDPLQQDQKILPRMRAAKVTVTTVGVATHGAPQDVLMKQIATATKGQCYLPKKASELPAIYIKETRLIAQSFVHEQLFAPVVNFRAGPTAGFPDSVPNLRGFVRTTKKTGSNLRVEEALSTPPFAGQVFPLLASWQYGLGKSVAFTSDAGQPKFWSEDWAKSPLYGKFWEQIVDGALRPVESKNLTILSDYRDGRIHVVVEARTDKGEPDLNLRDLRAEVTPPNAGVDAPRRPKLKFEQRSPGVYEAEAPADEAGSYFIGFQTTRMVDGKPQRESVRGSVTVPYAAEFADLESNPELLKQLAFETGGESYKDDETDLDRVARAGTVFRPGLPGIMNPQPVWPWLLFMAAILLLIDVCLRRLALERFGIGTALGALWDRLRGRGIAAPVTATLDRLQSRKAKVSEELSSRRFEPGDRPVSPLEGPTGQASTPRATPPAAAPPPAQPQESEAEDFFSRLQRRKKQIKKDRGDEPEQR